MHSHEHDSPTIFSPKRLEAFRRERRIDPYYMGRLRRLYLQFNRPFEEAVNELPQPFRADFQAAFRPHNLVLAKRSDSELDGATKMAFVTDAGDTIETVLLRIPGKRISLCVSSQVGCAARCEFCATGHLSPVRNLDAAEILSQVVVARQIASEEGRRVRNLVFMGMGEPFHNATNVMRAASLIIDDSWFALGPRRTLVSTVGVPEAMIQWAKNFPKSPIGLSLHSADQEVRERIIPVARKTPLGELRLALDEVVQLQHDSPVMIEYLMLRGLNDSLKQAEQLADFLAGLPALVNLIPLNPIAESPHLSCSDRDVCLRFGAALQKRGFLVKFRHSLGGDIDAACGQLARRR